MLPSDDHDDGEEARRDPVVVEDDDGDSSVVHEYSDDSDDDDEPAGTPLMAYGSLPPWLHPEPHVVPEEEEDYDETNEGGDDCSCEECRWNREEPPPLEDAPANNEHHNDHDQPPPPPHFPNDDEPHHNDDEQQHEAIMEEFRDFLQHYRMGGHPPGCACEVCRALLGVALASERGREDHHDPADEECSCFECTMERLAKEQAIREYEEGSDSEDDEEGDPDEHDEEDRPRCAVCMGSRRPLVVLPCCGGGNKEESSSTRFCQKCIRKTLETQHRQRQPPPTPAAYHRYYASEQGEDPGPGYDEEANHFFRGLLTGGSHESDEPEPSVPPGAPPACWTGECPRCRSLISMEVSSGPVCPSSPATAPGGDNPIRKASVRQTLGFVFDKDPGLRTLLFVLAHSYASWLPIELLEDALNPSGTNENDDAASAAKVRETIRQLHKWNLLEVRREDRLYRLVPSVPAGAEDAIPVPSDPAAETPWCSWGDSPAASPAHTRDVFYRFYTDPEYWPSYFEDENGPAAPILDDTKWRQRAWINIASVHLHACLSALARFRLPTAARLFHQSLVGFAKSHGFFPALYHSPMLGVLSTLLVVLLLALALVGGSLVAVGYGALKWAGWWARLSPDEQQLKWAELAVHTACRCSLGVSFWIQGTTRLLVVALTKLARKVRLERRLPEKCPHPELLVRSGVWAVGLAWLLWSWRGSAAEGPWWISSSRVPEDVTEASTGLARTVFGILVTLSVYSLNAMITEGTFMFDKMATVSIPPSSVAEAPQD